MTARTRQAEVDLTQWIVAMVIMVIMLVLLWFTATPTAQGQDDISWTFDKRLKAAEKRLDSVEDRLKKLEGKTTASDPKVKRVQVNGLWYDQHEDGRMEECKECNVGKVVSWKAGAVYVPEGQPVGVPVSYPFASNVGSWGLQGIGTGVPTATWRSAPYTAGIPTGPIPMYVQGAGTPRLTRRLFRGGCASGGGCP